MSDFPTLTAMGIGDIHKISRFVVRHETTHDELKVYFKQGVDSCQPASLKFRLPHQDNDNGATMEQAVSELNRLLGENPTAEDPRAAIIESLDQFERVMHGKMEEIRQRLTRMTS